jgi:hypothetical protein
MERYRLRVVAQAARPDVIPDASLGAIPATIPGVDARGVVGATRFEAGRSRFVSALRRAGIVIAARRRQSI